MKNILHYFIIALFLFVCPSFLSGQSFEVLSLQREIASQVGSLTNGYDRYIRGDDYGYDNMWNRNMDAFLTRAANGRMVLEWESEKVEKIVDGKARFLFLVALPQGAERVSFSFGINQKPLFDIRNLPGDEWKQGKEGVELSFKRFARNTWGDGIGFMVVTVPAAMIQRGESTRFQLIGEKAESNMWFMIFKSRQLLEEVVTRSRTDAYYVVESDLTKHVVTFPAYWAGRKVIYIDGSGKENTAFLQKKERGAEFTIPRMSQTQSLTVKSEAETLFHVNDLFLSGQKSSLLGDILTLIEGESLENGKHRVSIAKEFSLSQSKLDGLSRSYYAKAKVHVMVSSHQDIAWMDSPYQCIEDRDKKIIAPALNLLEKHADYRYDIENVLSLREYIGRHPDQTAQITRLIRNGQLGIGASYTQPYEEVQSGEALIRQFYFGKRWVDKTFQGVSPRTYWNVDVPGRTLQMPQILKKSGVDYLMYSRHQMGLYRWFAPDGSQVLTFSPGHYTSASHFLHKDPLIVVDNFVDYMNRFPDYRSDKQKQPIVGMLSAEDMSQARTYYNWAEMMNAYADTNRCAMPEMVHATATLFMDDARANNTELPELRGERPDLWQYIHFPTHEKAFTTYREANRDLVSAEILSTVNAALSNDFAGYPQKEIDAAWEAIIYPDHGWGGNKGNITDSLFTAKYLFAKEQASRLKKQAMKEIAAHIRYNKKWGTPIVVYNTMSVKREAPVSISVLLPADGSFDNTKLVDNTGKSVPFQIQPQISEATSIATLTFIAQQVPSIGYATYYLSTAVKGRNQMDAGQGSMLCTPHIETPYYRLTFERGKLVQITDKELNRPLFDISKFAIGDVICMRSVGNGAGEFSTMQKPSMDHYEQASLKGASWEICEEGPVYYLLRLATKFQEAGVQSTMKVYKQLKRIDIQTDILHFTGANYLEFRQMFPFTDRMQVTYDVPFGRVRVGKDEISGVPGERYQDEAKNIHPRTMTHWMGVSDSEMSVKIASSVAVADYMDPTEQPIDVTILQPILFASRKSCHPLGEFYSQPGNHTATFSLFSGATADEQAITLSALSAHMPLLPLYQPKAYTDATLSDRESFFSLNTDAVWISTIKKAEDDEDVVVRMYDGLGQPNQLKLYTRFDLKQIQQTDLLENGGYVVTQEELSVGAHAIETFKLTLKK